MASNPTPTTRSKPRLAPMAYPHLIDQIIESLAVADLLSLTLTSRAFKFLAEKTLARRAYHVALSPVFKGEGDRSITEPWGLFSTTTTCVDRTAPLPRRFLKHARILDDLEDQWPQTIQLSIVLALDALEMIRVKGCSEAIHRYNMFNLDGTVKMLVIFVTSSWQVQGGDHLFVPELPNTMVLSFDPFVESGMSRAAQDNVFDLCHCLGARERIVLLNHSDVKMSPAVHLCSFLDRPAALLKDAPHPSAGVQVVADTDDEGLDWYREESATWLKDRIFFNRDPEQDFEFEIDITTADSYWALVGEAEFDLQSTYPGQIWPDNDLDSCTGTTDSSYSEEDQ